MATTAEKPQAASGDIFVGTNPAIENVSTAKSWIAALCAGNMTTALASVCQSHRMFAMSAGSGESVNWTEPITLPRRRMRLPDAGTPMLAVDRTSREMR